MADYTDDDVARLAEMLVTLAWDVRNAGDIAVDLLAKGVTLPPPPPDPAVVVAEHLWGIEHSIESFRPDCDRETTAAVYLDTMRDLFTTDALKAAAAKVQKAKAPTVKCPVWCVRPKGHDGDHLAIPAGSDRFA